MVKKKKKARNCFSPPLWSHFKKIQLIAKLNACQMWSDTKHFDEWVKALTANTHVALTVRHALSPVLYVHCHFTSTAALWGGYWSGPKSRRGRLHKCLEVTWVVIGRASFDPNTLAPARVLHHCTRSTSNTVGTFSMSGTGGGEAVSPSAGPLLNPPGLELVTAVCLHYWVSGSCLSMLAQHSRSAVPVAFSITGGVGNCLFRRAKCLH